MTPSTVFPDRTLLAIVLVLVTVFHKAVSIQESAEVSESEVQESGAFPNEQLPSNRVLPVDAEHKSRITFTHQPLDALCVKNLRDNLVEFLKRVKRSGNRKGRQDDGDDGDDGDEGGGGGGLAGVFGNLAEGNGALSTLAAVPALFPSLVSTLTQTAAAANQALNGTDTPNLPSFFAKQASDAIKLFQTLNGGGGGGGGSRPSAPAGPPPSVHVQRIPGEPPMRKPRPTQGYEYPTDTDYPDEEVKQPPQPTLKPLTPEGSPGRPEANYQPNPGVNNPFFQNANNRFPISNPGPSLPESNNNGGPYKTSLWSIYKSFRTRNEGSNLTDFQLAHPEAFSNELLHSISQSISNIRTQGVVQLVTDTPPSEVLKQAFPPVNPIQSNPNRPTLSFYKPSGSGSGGFGLDLNTLALNASLAANNEQEQPAFVPEPEITTTTAPFQQQNELEAVVPPSPSPGSGHSVQGGSASSAEDYENIENPPQPQLRPTQSPMNTADISPPQNEEQESYANGHAQFVKSPTSSHLTIAVDGYIPAIASLHEDEEPMQVGPQASVIDTSNGVNTHKTPYTPVNNGILYTAPRLKPSPLVNMKRPTGIVGNFEDPKRQTTPQPTYHFSNSGAGPVPPRTAQRPPDPNALRPSTLIAAIPSRFEASKNPLKTNGIVPPSSLPNKNDNVPEALHSVRITSTTPPFIPETTPGIKWSQHFIEEDIVSSHEENQAPTIPPPLNTVLPPQKISPLFSLYQNLISQNPPQRLNTTPRPVIPDTTAATVSLIRSSESPFASSLLGQSFNQLQQQQNLLFQQQSIINNLKFPQQASQPPQPSGSSSAAFQALNQIFGINPPSKTPLQTPPPTTLNSFSVTTEASTTPPVSSGGHSSGAVESTSASSLAGLYPFPNRPVFSQRPYAPNGISNPVQSEPQISNHVTNKPEPSLSSQLAEIQPVPPQITSLNSFPSFGTIPIHNENIQSANLNQDVAPQFEEIITTEKIMESTTALPTPIPSGTEFLFPHFANSPQFPGAVQISTTSQPVIQEEADDLQSSGNKGGNSEFFPNSIVSGPLQNNGFIHLQSPEPSQSTSSDNFSVNFNRPGGYPSAFFPQVSPIGNSPVASNQNVKPLVINESVFQRPVLNSGYPAPSLPIRPDIGGPVDLFNPVQSSNSGTPTLSDGDLFQYIVAQQNRNKTLAPPSSQMGSPRPPNAIAEMSKLPYFQEQSFRPQSLPAYLKGHENQEDLSLEQGEASTKKSSISELFSNLSKVAENHQPTTPSPLPSLLNPGLSQPGAAGIEDSAEAVPNFPPGKPVYWMNMYYPNGYPVLTKVTEPTFTPGRRRRQSTTFETTTGVNPEIEDYEDEDESTVKRIKKIVP